MRRVFICSPYAGDIRANVERARKMCLMAIRRGYAPFAPHLIYPQLLDDCGTDRTAGISAGIAFLEACFEVWVPRGVKPSIGMTCELDVARSLDIPIVRVNP
jgi:hypothetical protein